MLSMSRVLMLGFIAAAIASDPRQLAEDGPVVIDFKGMAGPNYTFWATKLREDKIGDNSGYDKVVPPTSDRAANADDKFGGLYSKAGTDLKMQVRFFKVQAVEAAKGSMSLKVWLRYSWQDSRLAWDPADYGGITKAYYQGDMISNGEENEIWLPDVQPYNSYIGIAQTLDAGYAQVSSDGSIFYSRPGTLEVMCKFSGLVAFPFDEMKCQIEFGGWGLSGGVQGIQLSGDGYQFSTQEATSGSSYQEYTIKGVDVEYAFYSYPCCPSEPWPAVIYTIQLKRAGGFYNVVAILPGIIVTLLSFVVFWTDTKSADALSYGVTIIVVNLLLNVVLINMLPVCGELIWIDMFSMINTFFCCLSLFQSAFMIMLETHEGDHLAYTFLALAAKKLFKMLPPLNKNKVGISTKTTSMTADSQLSSDKYVVESIAGVLYRQQPGLTRASQGTAKPIVAGSAVSAMEASPEERMRKLVAFETLFYKIDTNGNQMIDVNECDKLLSFCAIDMDPKDRKAVFESYDLVKDGQLNRMEFCTLCKDHLFHIPTDVIEKMAINLNSTHDAKTTSNSNYWSSMGERIEKRARVVLPALYILALIVVFNLDMRDSYFDGMDMFTGITSELSLTSTGVGLLVAYFVIMIGAFITTWFVDREVKKMLKATEAAQKNAAIEKAHSLVGAGSATSLRSDETVLKA